MSRERAIQRQSSRRLAQNTNGEGDPRGHPPKSKPATRGFKRNLTRICIIRGAGVRLTPMARTGFVGLGVMGGPMAGHLVRAGQEVTVWNRTASKSASLATLGARVATDLAELARECSTVFICVSRTEDVQGVVAQLAPNLAKGSLIVDHSTIAPPAATQIHCDLAAQGLRFVDAPVTGGSMGAQNGTLVLFLGGSEADTEEAKRLAAPYTKRAERVGGPGAGQMAKMANQIAVGGALLALCEALNFASKAGLDLPLVREMLSGGAGGSWAFDNYGPKILNQDWSPGFSVINQRKDFLYCREAATEIGAVLPGTEVVDALLAKLEEAGRGEDTTAALYEILQEMRPGP